MTESNGDYNEHFREAEKIWDLPEIYATLKDHGFQDKSLNKAILRGVLLDLEQKQIADQMNCSTGHILTTQSNEISPSIKSRFESTNKNVNWSRVPKLFERAGYRKEDKDQHGSPLPSDSQPDFYVDLPILDSCYNQILKPGCLIRIKAPRKMGKTELMSKICNYANNQGYRTVNLNLRLTEKTDLDNLDTFLQWFCCSITQKLRLPNSVDEHWNTSLGNSKIKCETYFEDYLLSGKEPLALFLDDVDKIFPYQDIAGDFFGLLRTWHEESKTSDTWKQFRLVLVYREEYKINNLNKSPFNVEGPEINWQALSLNQEQVGDLAQKYGLKWETAQVMQLMDRVGGHPYLVKTAIEKIQKQGIQLEQLEHFLSMAVTETEITKYLKQHLDDLQQDSELLESFKKVVTANDPVQVNLDYADQLYNLGLVEMQGNSVTPRYELYRQYFRAHLGDIR